MNPQDMIRELIQSVGNDAEFIIANGLGLKKKNKSYSCPSPHNHKNGDRNPSMGWDSNRYFFNCFGCGENIDIYSYYKNYCNYSFNDIMAENGIKSIDEKRKSFKSEVTSKWSKLTQEHKDYILSRGISGEVASKLKLGTCDGGIGLPYRKNGQVTGVKIRSLNTKQQGSRMRSVTGSKFFFFNYDNVDLDKAVVICEGEFDCLTLIQCGINAVSVGCGANSLSALFEQADSFFDRVDEFIICADNDENGRNMEQAFVERLGEKAVIVNISAYQGYKDVNELYLAKGSDAVKALINSGQFKFDGEWDLDENPYTGLDEEGYRYIPTGIPSVDDAINDIQTSTVTLITGRSNGGKSTFVNQIAASSVSNGYKTYLAIGEGNKYKIINKWYSSMIGYNQAYYTSKKLNKKWIKEPKKNVLEALQKWHKGLLKLYVKSLSKYKTTDQFFNMLEKSVKKNKYDLIILDNLMSLLKVSRASEKNEEQSLFVEKCHALADNYNCAIIIVLHPSKGYIKSDDIEMEHISGTMDIANKADVILGVVRYYEEHDKYKEGVNCQIQVVKNRDWEQLPKVNCKYLSDTNNYAEIDGDKILGVNNATWKKYLTKANLEKLEEDPKKGERWEDAEEEFPF